MSEKVSTLTNPPVRVINEDSDAFFGLTFPLTYKSGNAGFFPRSSTIREQVSTNIKNLLLTIPGERVNQPTFGCELTSLIFEPQEEGLEDRIEAAIEEALAQWLPYVTINTIDIILTPDDNQVLVNLEFLVNVDDEDAPEQISFNFNTAG